MQERVLSAEHTFNRNYVSEVWLYRELIAFLGWRDIKIKYQHAFLGAAWALLQPLLNTVVFSLLFGRLAKLPSDGVPYPVFSLLGFVPWMFFSHTVQQGAQSLVSHSNMIRKIYFPRMVLPIASSGVIFLDAACNVLCILGFFAYYQLPIRLTWLYCIPIACMLALFSISVGLLMAGMNVKYRDIKHALPFLMQLWMIASPVAYSSRVIEPAYQWLYQLNPMVGYIEALRACLLGTPLSFFSLGYALISTLFLLSVSLYYFHQTETYMMDHL